MLSFFDQKYNSSLMQRSDKCVIVDTELESFFLRKNIKKLSFKYGILVKILNLKTFKVGEIFYGT